MPYKNTYILKGDQLKQRILLIKPKIKQLMPQYLESFLESNPEYNNRKGIQEIRAVLQTMKSNEDLTIRLEAFAKDLELKAQNTNI